MKGQKSYIQDETEFILRPGKGWWEQKRGDDHMIAVQREQTVYLAKMEIYPDSSTGLEYQHLKAEAVGSLGQS